MTSTVNSIPVNIPVDFRSKFDRKMTINEETYWVYRCSYKDKLEGISPLPYRDLTSFLPPLGQNKPRHIEDGADFYFGRLISYVPIIGIIPGGVFLGQAAYAIYRYVILNNGSLYQYKYYQDDENKVHLYITEKHEVTLDCCQRLAVLGLSIALMVRGIFSILGIGIILLPLDCLYDRLCPRLKNMEYTVVDTIPFDLGHVGILDHLEKLKRAQQQTTA